MGHAGLVSGPQCSMEINEFYAWTALYINLCSVSDQRPAFQKISHLLKALASVCDADR